MPYYKDAMSHGNLYIKFLVQFPKKGELKDHQIKELQKVDFCEKTVFFTGNLGLARTQSGPRFEEGKS